MSRVVQDSVSPQEPESYTLGMDHGLGAGSNLLTMGWPEGKMPGQLSALTGPKGILGLYPWFLAPALLAGERIFVADGGNFFNPYDFSEIAAHAGCPPGELLRRIQISRAFTCHQMLALVRRLARFTRRARVRVIVLLGLLESYYDEAVPVRETSRTWQATLNLLRCMAGEGFLILAVCPDHSLESKRALRRFLVGVAERAMDCRRGEDGLWRLCLIKPGIVERDAPTGLGVLGAVWKVG